MPDADKLDRLKRTLTPDSIADLRHGTGVMLQTLDEDRLLNAADLHLYLCEAPPLNLLASYFGMDLAANVLHQAALEEFGRRHHPPVLSLEDRWRAVAMELGERLNLMSRSDYVYKAFEQANLPKPDLVVREFTGEDLPASKKSVR